MQKKWIVSNVMKHRMQHLARSISLGICIALGVGSASAAPKPERSPLTATGEKLQAQYRATLTALQAEIAKSLPNVNEQKKAAFLKASADETKAAAAAAKAQSAAAAKNVKNKEEAGKALKAAQAALAQAQTNALKATTALLAEVEPFLASDRLDAKLIKCTVLAAATPRGLAGFAQQGQEQEALMEKLLADDALMKQMLIAGGAEDGKYGRAMGIYTAIQKASPKAGEGLFQRLALGTSLEHAVPVAQRNAAAKTNAPTIVDPVKRYLHYEKACLDGELDPAFKTLSVWEYRMVVNCDAPDQVLAWGREMLRNYRPDHIHNPNYGWRYSATVKTEVKYGGEKEYKDTDSLEFYQNIIKTGGVCGRRAFFGRFILRSFGIPVWGVTQHAHAALGHWTPKGWVVNLGAAWKWSWWRDRSGTDFLLETQAREHAQEYPQVLRAQWISAVLDEQAYNDRLHVAGGFWSAVAHGRAQAIVAAAKAVELGPLGQDLAEANESKKAEAMLKAEVTAADNKIVVGQNGVITIPAVACSTPKDSTAKIVFMKSFAGGMQLHYNRLGNAEDFEYTFDAPQAGKYVLSARVVTVNADQHLLVAANDAKEPVDIAVLYTLGMWQQTQPVEISLVNGKNVLHFTLQDGSRGVTIKDFTLTPVK